MTTQTSICTKCKQEKDASKFRRHAGMASGLHSYCKTCLNKHIEDYFKTPVGLLSKIYSHQRGNSRQRGHEMPNYTLKELRSFALSNPTYIRLHKQWAESGYETALVPSFDRLDDYKPYTLDSLSIVTWQENKERGRQDRLNGVNNKASKSVKQLSLKGRVMNEYYSIHEASRRTGLSVSNISAAVRGKVKTSGGFRWEYA